MSDSFIETVQNENNTALSRLGSSKALYAETSGQLEADTVLRAAAIAEDAARETFENWAEDESNEAAAELFAAVASEEADHYETVAGKIDDPPRAADTDESPAIQSTLRSFESTIERAGGLVGRSLVAKKSKEQYTGYFVGDADPQAASVFRELGGDVDGQRSRAAELVDEVCETPADSERAQVAATEAIQAAYSEYTESLESMGVNPKPVC